MTSKILILSIVIDAKLENRALYLREAILSSFFVRFNIRPKNSCLLVFYIIFLLNINNA